MKKRFLKSGTGKLLNEAVFKQFHFRLGKLDNDTLDGLTPDGLAELISDAGLSLYNEKEASIGYRRIQES